MFLAKIELWHEQPEESRRSATASRNVDKSFDIALAMQNRKSNNLRTRVVSGREREREGKRKSGKVRERETDRERERQREIHTHRDRERETHTRRE